MELFLLTGCLFLIFMCIGLAIQSNKSQQTVQERMSTLSIGGNSSVSKPKVLREKALEESFTGRVLFPLAQKIFDKTQLFIPLSSKSWVKIKLVQAGYLKPHYQKVFLGIQLCTTLCMFGMLFAFTMLFGKVNGMVGLFISGMFGAIGYGLPMIWLIQQAKKRQESIQKSLADFLDLLVICVEAGLGLDTAIHKLSTMRSTKTSEYLQEELQRYTRDIGLGKSRKESLLDLGYRTGVDDLNTIVNALVQAYEMGTGVSTTLRVQSDSLRVKRLQKAEEKANKIPVKMVMPIYMFLFPAIFVTIFGPIGMVLIETMFTIFNTMNHAK